MDDTLKQAALAILGSRVDRQGQAEILNVLYRGLGPEGRAGLFAYIVGALMVARAVGQSEARP